MLKAALQSQNESTTPAPTAPDADEIPHEDFEEEEAEIDNPEDE